MSVGRKIFHCVVDETALAANIGDIKKWTSQGAITLIVPVYTLERLRSLRKASSQIGVNARESVRFLDRVTSGKHSIPTSKIVLQGPMEQFETWEEVEKYILPEFQEEMVNTSAPSAPTPAPLSPPSPMEQKLSEKDVEVAKRMSDLNEMSQMLLSKLNFKRDADTTYANSTGTLSVPTSSTTCSSHPSPEYTSRQLEGSQGNDSSSADEEDGSEPVFVNPIVPKEIKPLLNAIIWRLHGHPDANTAASGCILVTNDRSTQTWAQKFGITVKNVPQLRTSIIYEEKEFKNHCKYQEKNPNNDPKPLLSYEDESEEDVLVFVPRGQKKPSSPGNEGRKSIHSSPVAPRISNNHTNGVARGKVASPSEPHVEVPSVPIDPDSFNRNVGVAKPQGGPNTNNTHRGSAGHLHRPNGSGRRGAPRGGGMFRGTGRGRGRLWVP
ncbi:hypothetical protein LOZ12_000909 [Ophidiomyces ophidiicola]|uniref:Uncharacterized protein n=1 Tax=Ophidiomyces ophidiicola TaxID=1387563 RepID=A0ACB8UQ65_9EURO|nr:uncharacterized protein LOZ57_003257 [Ophidiomyces ophidiicola]KAI1936440.1 hypothetical protein LOZ62_005716 [Ophidiomyces ophidiicola]KAI1947528.1 hypothetical protein LOZ57_003257 [Ophidiomyces ophidiicola]KAI1959189.1 hypothetical protein LOZ56_006851 [Ophidiomyces ophidiicola]KAI2011800.1 hypothetical protein LOZ50_000484 [Ophidiomyces ophidiicola]KAI2019872.1 hypothetical protein LOZ45_005373 [Ophidiomyces ophidiicola]